MVSTGNFFADKITRKPWKLNHFCVRKTRLKNGKLKHYPPFTYLKTLSLPRKLAVMDFMGLTRN